MQSYRRNKTSLTITARKVSMTSTQPPLTNVCCTACLAEGLVDEPEVHSDLQHGFCFLQSPRAVIVGSVSRMHPCLLHRQGRGQSTPVSERRDKAEGQVATCDTCTHCCIVKCSFHERVPTCHNMREPLTSSSPGRMRQASCRAPLESWPHAASSNRKPALVCSTLAAAKPRPSLHGHAKMLRTTPTTS